MKLVANDYEAKDILRIIREWLDLTQADFGKNIDRCERTIQEYEAGRTKYSMNMVLDLAKKHGIKITFEKQ